MKMCFTCTFIFIHIKLIFMRKLLHERIHFEIEVESNSEKIASLLYKAVMSIICCRVGQSVWLWHELYQESSLNRASRGCRWSQASCYEFLLSKGKGDNHEFYMHAIPRYSGNNILFPCVGNWFAHSQERRFVFQCTFPAILSAQWLHSCPCCLLYCWVHPLP